MEPRWTPADTGVPVWVALLPVIAGMLFVGYLGGSSLLDNYHLQTRGRSVTTDFVTVTNAGKGGTRVDTWFQTADGHLVKARLKRYRNVESDQEIQVEYDPEHPETAQQAGVGYDYLDGAFKLVLSALTLWGTTFVIVASRRKRVR
jgi:hypothetical protein